MCDHACFKTTSFDQYTLSLRRNQYCWWVSGQMKSIGIQRHLGIWYQIFQALCPLQLVVHELKLPWFRSYLIHKLARFSFSGYIILSNFCNMSIFRRSGILNFPFQLHWISYAATIFRIKMRRDERITCFREKPLTVSYTFFSWALNHHNVEKYMTVSYTCLAQ